MKTKNTPYGIATILEGRESKKYFLLEKVVVVGGMFGTVYYHTKHIYGYNGQECYKYPIKQFKRAMQLLTDEHEPRYVRVYDNGGETIDRYTVVYTGNYSKGTGYNKAFSYLGLSVAPYLPNGYCQHGESNTLIDKPTYSHLGKKIKFSDLPLDCQLVVFEDYASLWGFSGETK